MHRPLLWSESGTASPTATNDSPREGETKEWFFQVPELQDLWQSVQNSSRRWSKAVWGNSLLETLKPVDAGPNRRDARSPSQSPADTGSPGSSENSEGSWSFVDGAGGAPGAVPLVPALQDGAGVAPGAVPLVPALQDGAGVAPGAVPLVLALQDGAGVAPGAVPLVPALQDGAGVAPGAVPHDGAGGAPEAVPLVPALLAELRRHVTCGFQDTRVLEAQANFFQDLMMPVERYLLTHGCVVLGPSGVGKTTLVNRLCGAHFHTGPRMEDQTTRAHSCDLTLEDLSPDWPDLCSVLIDTPGWSSETAGEIKSEYKRILQERQLVSEYTPHILLFCVSLPQLRAFRRQAEQMSQELQELKIDRRYPIKVLPVATLADTQRMEDLEELLKEVKDLAEIVFHKSSAEVEEPAWTMFNPNGDCGNDRGAKEVKARLSKIVYQQIQSPEFRHLWQGAFAEHVAQKTEEHTELFPENDSTLRLFRCAFHTVAAVSGQEVSDRESFNEITQTMVDLPWDIISSIPQNDEIWSMATARGNFLRLWLGLVILAWIGDCYTILLALFMVLMLLPVIYVTILLFTDRQLLWHQVTQCFRRLERLEKVAAETTWPQWSSLWPQTPRDKRKCAFLLLSLLLLGSLHECFMMHEQLEAMAMEVNSEEMATRMAQEQVDRISGKYNYQRSPPAPSCAWDEMRGSCAGLSHLHGVRNVDQCREICCKMGSFCSTWQFSLSEGCRVGQPGVCRVDLFPLWWHPLLGQRK